MYEERLREFGKVLPVLAGSLKRFLQGSINSDRTMWNDFKLKEIRSKLDIKKKILHCEAAEAPEEVAQRSCECPIPGRLSSRTGGMEL